MASFTFKHEGNEIGDEKNGKFTFGFNKLRNVFGHQHHHHQHHQHHHYSDQIHRQGPLEDSPHTFGHHHHTTHQESDQINKQGPVEYSPHRFHVRPVMELSSSVPGRSDVRPVNSQHHHKNNSTQTPRRHPTLALSKSLPKSHKQHNFTPRDNRAACTAAVQEMTQNKGKLSRSGQETCLRYEKKLGIWRKDLAAVRNFCFDEELSLASDGNNPEDHIYEEIDNNIFKANDDEKDEDEDNFLLGISPGRRKNLKFYGSADWDFGN